MGPAAGQPFWDKEFWDDFAQRVSSSFSPVLSRFILDIIFVQPLHLLPVEVRAVVVPLRAARQQMLEQLVPSKLSGPPRRAFLRGLEAGAANFPQQGNPYPGRGRLARAWLAGRMVGQKWTLKR